MILILWLSIKIFIEYEFSYFLMQSIFMLESFFNYWQKEWFKIFSRDRLFGVSIINNNLIYADFFTKRLRITKSALSVKNGTDWFIPKLYFFIRSLSGWFLLVIGICNSPCFIQDLFWYNAILDKKNKNKITSPQVYPKSLPKSKFFAHFFLSSPK